MGESPRWHRGRFWLCDWLAGEVLAFGTDAVRAWRELRDCPSIDWLEADRSCFACMLGGPDGRTLYVVANHYDDGASDGIVFTRPVDVPHAGRPYVRRATLMFIAHSNAKRTDIATPCNGPLDHDEPP